jgi:hypothetical protein
MSPRDFTKDSHVGLEKEQRVKRIGRKERKGRKVVDLVTANGR